MRPPSPRANAPALQVGRREAAGVDASAAHGVPHHRADGGQRLALRQARHGHTPHPSPRCQPVKDLSGGVRERVRPRGGPAHAPTAPTRARADGAGCKARDAAPGLGPQGHQEAVPGHGAAALQGPRPAVLLALLLALLPALIVPLCRFLAEDITPLV